MPEPPARASVVEGNIWMELSRDNFVHALKTLSPGRITKALMSKELQIGLVNGEAVFCIQGASTRCQASGQWNGFVCLPYGSLSPYVRVPPDKDPVRLTFETNRLKLGGSRYPARWIDASPWISDMALTAHLFGPDEQPGAALQCPMCGKHSVLSRGGLLTKIVRTSREESMLNLLERYDATHACSGCRYGWREIKLPNM